MQKRSCIKFNIFYKLVGVFYILNVIFIKIHILSHVWIGNRVFLYLTWKTFVATNYGLSFVLSLSCASRVHSIHFIRFVYFTSGIIYFNFNWFQSILLFTFNYNSVFPCHRTPSHIAFVHNTCFEREIEQTKLYSLFYIINCILFMFNGNYFMCDHFDSTHMVLLE